MRAGPGILPGIHELEKNQELADHFPKTPAGCRSHAALIGKEF
jgi:hypothetical protein